MLPANVMGVGAHISPVVLPNSAALMAPTPGVTGVPAMHATAVPPCPTILLTCQPALNMGSIVPASPNIPPTLVPPVLPQMNVMGIPTILLQCLPATTITSPAISAGPPGITAIPDVTNVLFTYAACTTPQTGNGPARVTLEDLRAIRRSLSSPMIESSLITGGVGYLSIRRFASSVPSAAYHAVQTLTTRGMRSLIIDVRRNGGGEMAAFLELAGDFLEEGALIATVTDSDGDALEYRSHSSARHRMPVVVLVDEGTASAAEAFAGCLQSHGRAPVVGRRTYGKGEVQSVIASPDGLIYATVGTLTLPDGRAVHGLGVEPDIGWTGGELALPGDAPCPSLSHEVRDAIISLGATRPLRAGSETGNRDL